MATEFVPTLSAAEQTRLQLVAECDQRWAAAADSLWSVRASLLLELHTLLTSGRETFLRRVLYDPHFADVAAHLAALAFDEILARAELEGEGDG